MLKRSRFTVITLVAAVVLIASGNEIRAADVNMPIVMPITGYLSVEGASTRNGAVMAFEESNLDVKLSYEIFDTGTSATGAAVALEKAVSDGDAVAGRQGGTNKQVEKFL